MCVLILRVVKGARCDTCEKRLFTLLCDTNQPNIREPNNEATFLFVLNFVKTVGENCLKSDFDPLCCCSFCDFQMQCFVFNDNHSI